MIPGPSQRLQKQQDIKARVDRQTDSQLHVKSPFLFKNENKTDTHARTHTHTPQSEGPPPPPPSCLLSGETLTSPEDIQASTSIFSSNLSPIYMKV